jgi:probable F420-dependent oxidoreductase
MYEHVIGTPHENRDPPFEYFVSDKHPHHEPLITFAYLAGITQKIKFICGVMILAQRQTVLVAKQLADLSLLSGGRVRLGVGTGWNYVEYQALGVDWTKRGKILDEQIPYLRRLWTEDLVSIDGQFHQLDRGAIVPRPRQAIPIYIGGDSDVTFRRGARLGDGHIFIGPMERALAGLHRMGQMLAEQKRSFEGFDTHWFMLPSRMLPNRKNDIPTLVDELKRWRDAGGSAATIQTQDFGFTTARQHIDFMAEVSHRMGL